MAPVLQDFRDRCDALTVCAIAVLSGVYNLVGWGGVYCGVGLSGVCSFSGHKLVPLPHCTYCPCLSVRTGRTKLLKSAISTMLKQGMVKPSSPLGERDREGGVGKNTLNAILQAVKAACCHGTYVHSDRQTVQYVTVL